MAFRTVSISQRCKLSYSLNYLIIRGEEEKRIHLSEISKLILQSTQIFISSSLLSELSKRKIKLIICDEKHNPEAEMVSYYGAHNSSLRVKEQISWNENTLSEVWKTLIKYKIQNQSKVLKKYGCDDAKSMLDIYAENVQLGDLSNREGHAAKVYFNALFGNDFTRSNNSVINTFLNYGYTILLSMFNREIVSRGYLTQLGIHHKNEFNYFNLSCDIIEPFRPIIDDYAKTGVLDEENFKSKLNNIGAVKLTYNDKQTFLENGITLFVGSVIKAIESNDISELINYQDYEL